MRIWSFSDVFDRFLFLADPTYNHEYEASKLVTHISHFDVEYFTHLFCTPIWLTHPACRGRPHVCHKTPGPDTPPTSKYHKLSGLIPSSAKHVPWHSSALAPLTQYAPKRTRTIFKNPLSSALPSTNQHAKHARTFATQRLLPTLRPRQAEGSYPFFCKAGILGLLCF